MKRTHALLIALVLAVAVVLGSFAAIRSSRLSAASTPKVNAAQIARQNAALDRAEANLRAELAKKPPAVRALPAAAPAQTVIYRRPPAIVRVVHRQGGEHEDGEHEDGGFDD